MTRKIKASEVREGMEIEWKHGGYYTRCVVGLVQRENLSYPAYSIRAVESSAGGKIFSEGEEVTVLKEAQPEEPTAFGACVEVGGVKYVRIDSRSYAVETYCPWMDEGDSGYYRWDQITNLGHVTVINPDPFANTGQRGPRVWDRWADVPEMTPVRMSGIETPYRKVGGRIECKPVSAWEPSVTDEHELNKYSPFTEVLPGA